MSAAATTPVINRKKTGVLSLLTLSIIVILMYAPEHIQLLTVGMLIGFVFVHFGFGFAGNWQRFFELKESAGIRSHLWLLGIGSLVFFPALTFLPDMGITANGLIRPVGLNVLIGAFIFGIGMGLLGNCSSGTIRLLAEFRFRYYWVMACMVIGGTFAASQFEFWARFEQWGLFSFAINVNWVVGLVIHAVAFFIIYQIFIKIEQRHCGKVTPLFGSEYKDYLLNISPLIWAAAVLVLLNLSLLILSGFPWGVSWIFPKFGILTMDALGIESDWEFWQYTAMNEERIFAPVEDDTILMTSFGFFAGIALYHLLSHIAQGKEKSKRIQLDPFNLKKLVISTTAGLIMGFGAVTAFGCNIGGFFSAIVSGSLHGWLWFASAFVAMGLTIGLMRSRQCS